MPNVIRSAMTSPALHAKQLGLYRVESHNQALVGLARAIAKEICGRTGSVTMDEVRQGLGDLKPSSPNAYGCIFNTEEWVCIGWEPSTLKSNHARFIRRWKFNVSPR